MRKQVIVHVDDDEIMLGMVRNLLEAQGYEVISCITMTRAKSTLELRKADLVIIDCTIDVKYDGFILASVLSVVKKTTIILAPTKPPRTFVTLRNVPFIDKREFGEKPDILAEKVKELLTQ